MEKTRVVFMHLVSTSTFKIDVETKLFSFDCECMRTVFMVKVWWLHLARTTLAIFSSITFVVVSERGTMVWICSSDFLSLGLLQFWSTIFEVHQLWYILTPSVTTVTDNRISSRMSWSIAVFYIAWVLKVRFWNCKACISLHTWYSECATKFWKNIVIATSIFLHSATSYFCAYRIQISSRLYTLPPCTLHNPISQFYTYFAYQLI